MGSTPHSPAPCFRVSQSFAAWEIAFIVEQGRTLRNGFYREKDGQRRISANVISPKKIKMANKKIFFFQPDESPHPRRSSASTPWVVVDTTSHRNHPSLICPRFLTIDRFPWPINHPKMPSLPAVISNIFFADETIVPIFAPPQTDNRQ